MKDCQISVKTDLSPAIRIVSVICSLIIENSLHRFHLHGLKKGGHYRAGFGEKKQVRPIDISIDRKRRNTDDDFLRMNRIKAIYVPKLDICHKNKK